MKAVRIERENLYNNVYNQILENIMIGTWKEGDKLPSEAQLCKEFNVSRVSIRSALQALRAQGYIITNQGMGSFITGHLKKTQNSDKSVIMDLTKSEFIQLQEFRQAIEFQSFILATKKADEQDFAEVEKCLNDMRMNKDNFEKYTEADFMFHLNITKASKNMYLYNVMLDYKVHIISLLYGMHSANEDRSFSLENHANILEALRQGDPAKATGFLKRSYKYNITRYADNFRAE